MNSFLSLSSSSPSPSPLPLPLPLSRCIRFSKLGKSIVPFAGALALGPTFTLVIRVPVPTGVALPFPLSRTALPSRLHGHPLPGRGTASPESGRHSSHQRHPTQSRRPRCAWAARAFQEDGRTVTLAFTRRDIALGWLGTLSTAGDTGDRMRWLGTTGC